MNITPGPHMMKQWLAAVSLLVMVTASAQAGERYAILVGVQKYTKTSGLRDLTFTERDVAELATTLIKGGWRAENVTQLTQKQALEQNDLRYYPSRENIQQELSGRLQLLEPEDSLLVAFAGHGLQFRNDESYFCPADANIDDKATLISLKSVYDALEACSAQFKLLLCDACRNAPISAVTRRAVVDVESVTRPQTVKPPGGVAALFGCSPGEFAFEDQGLKHGVFFHYVIQGLIGAADLDNDRRVDLLELTKYTQKQVKHFVFTRFDRARQIPHLVGTTRGEFPLITIPPKPVTPQLANLKVGEVVVVTAEASNLMIGSETTARARRGDRFVITALSGLWLNTKVPSTGDKPGWIRQHDVRREVSPPPRDNILVKWSGQWWPAKWLRTEGDKTLIHYYGHDASQDEWVTGDRISQLDREFEPYEVLAPWNGNLWPARVLKQEAGKYLIHFVGYNHTWDEWMAADQVRPPQKNHDYHRRINAELSRR